MTEMEPLPDSVTDAELIAFVDGWAAHLEREDYAAAFGFTDHDPAQDWTPELLRDVIKAYGDARKAQRVTVAGVASDVTQHKEVARWKPNPRGEVGEIWYDLNIDGVASDLTATFRLVRVPAGLVVRLNDVHVM
jgi:hypothetical protein